MTDIRSHTRAYATKSDAMGVLSLVATLAAYAAALTIGAKYALTPWISVPMVAVLDELSRTDLEHILQNTKNSLVKQYGKLFAMEGVDLHFTRDGIAAIAEKAMALKTGARALRAIMERLMLDVMFEIPDQDDIDSVTISRPVVTGRAKPKIRRRREEKKDAA